MQTAEMLNNIVEMYNYGYKIPEIQTAYKKLHNVTPEEIEEAFITILASKKAIFIQKLKTSGSKILLTKKFETPPIQNKRAKRLTHFLAHFRLKSDIEDLLDKIKVKPSTVSRWYKIFKEMEFDLENCNGNLTEIVNIDMVREMVDMYNKKGLTHVLDTYEWETYKEIVLLLCSSTSKYITFTKNKINLSITDLPRKGTRYFKNKKLIRMRNEGYTSLEISDELELDLEIVLKKVKLFQTFDLC